MSYHVLPNVGAHGGTSNYGSIWASSSHPSGTLAGNCQYDLMMFHAHAAASIQQVFLEGLGTRKLSAAAYAAQNPTIWAVENCRSELKWPSSINSLAGNRQTHPTGTLTIPQLNSPSQEPRADPEDLNFYHFNKRRSANGWECLRNGVPKLDN